MVSDLHPSVLRGSKDQVKTVGKAMGVNTMQQTTTLVFRQLWDVMQRKGIQDFSVADIDINVPDTVPDQTQKRGKAKSSSR